MTDFEAMNQMVAKDQDIRMSGSLISTQSVKQGGHVTFGVDTKTLMDITLTPDQYYVVMYVVNKEQFKAIKGD